MTNSIAELANAQTIFVIGSNTTEAHPVIALQIKKAVRNGAHLIVADPRRIWLADIAEVYLQHRPGTDVALVNAMMYVILDEGLEDRQFIDERTEGFEELREIVMQYPPERSAEICGVPAEDIRRAARLYASVERAAICYTLGITEHVCGTENVRTLANLAMLTGNVGKESTGVNPLRGQNNVQGACDMGAMPEKLPGYQDWNDPAIREKFERAWNCRLPTEPGFTAPRMFDAALEGKLKALYVMGEDIVMSEANAFKVMRALQQLELLVVQDIFMNETAKFAHVILPAACFAEKDGTFTNSERRVQRIRKAVEPPGEARPDWEILCEVARRLGYRMHYNHTSEIWDEIASICPLFAGINYERIEKVGIQWPCPSPDHPGTLYLHKGKFTRGLGQFAPFHWRPPAEEPDEEYPFILTTGRTLFNYNAATMTQRTAGIRQKEREPFVQIHPDDALRIGARDGEPIKVITRRGEVVVKARITERIRPGVIWMPFHFVDGAANILTNDALDNITDTAEYKVCAARVEIA